MCRWLSRLGLILYLALLMPGLAAGPARGAEQRFSLGLGFEFATGDYGTDLTTDSYRIPLMVSFYPSDRIDLALEIPYVYQSNSTTVPLGGYRYPRMGDPTMDSGSGMMGRFSGRVSENRTASQSGPGDITLTAGYGILQESAGRPLVRPLLYAKFPTADDDKGLGTGEFDFGGGLSLAKWFGSWAAYLEGMYLVPGSSAGFDPDNYWTWLGSLSYLVSDKLNAGVVLSGATAAFKGAPDALEAKVRLNYWTSTRSSLGGYVAKGLRDGSPDFGLGLFGAVSW